MNIILKIIKTNDLRKKIFFIISFILSLLLILFSINFNEFLNNKEIYRCSLDQNIDYNVKIFPNDIFDKTILPKNTTYINKLVDDINVQYNYSHSSGLNGNLDLYYTVNATTLMIENSNKNDEDITNVPPIKKKEHLLKDREKISSADNKNAYISDTMVVDYDTYTKEVKEFKKDIYSPTYSALLLDFKVEAVKTLEDGINVSSITTGSVKIPLDEESFVITTNFIPEENKKFMKYDNPKIYINYILLTLGCIYIVLNFILIYLNKKLYYKYYLKSSENAKLEKFLFKFKDIIFETKEKTEFISKNEIFINDFEALSNLYSVLNQPIFYYKDTSDKEMITNYFCMNYYNTSYTLVFKTQK